MVRTPTQRWHQLEDGSLAYAAERPGPDWHAHGWTPRQLWVLGTDGGLALLRFKKRRWRLKGTNTTIHDRPELDLPYQRYGHAALVLLLWAWLAGSEGHRALACARPHDRTLGRWTRRAAARATELMCELRRAVIDFCTPRLIEQMFPTGLPPPGPAARRRVFNPRKLAHLWDGLVLVVGGANRTKTPLWTLLAGARRRCWVPEPPFPI